MEEQLPFKFKIESPQQHQIIDTKVIVKGWVLHQHPVTSATVSFLNQTYVLPLTVARPDIQEVYPYYKNTPLGFELAIDAFQLRGKGLMKFSFLDDNGLIASQSLVISRKEDAGIGKVESIPEATGFSKNSVLSGYFISPIKEKYIDVFVDDLPLGTISDFIERPDLMSLHQSEDHILSGWNISLPDTELSLGEHTVSLNYYEQEQCIHTETFTLVNKSKEELIVIENTHLLDDEKKLNVIGYFLSENADKKLTASIGQLSPVEWKEHIARPDLQNQFAQYGHHLFGFEGLFDIQSLAEGNYDISVVTLTKKNRLKSASSQSFFKNKTQWLDNIKEGDIPSKAVFFDELKANLINVIEDYIDLGVDNEALLIEQTSQLFTGEIIPSRNDWTILTAILNELATVKELGTGYHLFLSDVSDSLGVSDLEKIKDFIDYIQTLAPSRPAVSIDFAPEKMYHVIDVVASSLDDFEKTVDIEWDVSSIPMNTATIQFEKVTQEDIKEYFLTISAGKYSEYLTIPAAEDSIYTLDLDWNNWFDLTYETPYLSAEVKAVDKRGNYSQVGSVVERLPDNQKPPMGPESYHLEWKLNSGNWNRITTTQLQSYKQTLAYNTYGNAQYRVRAIDKNTTSQTDWALSNVVAVNSKPPVPGKPNPSGVGDYFYVDIKWPAVPYAEYYEIWNSHDINSAKEKGWYVKTTALNCRISNLQENCSHAIYVRAVNVSGSAETMIWVKTKQRTPSQFAFGCTAVKTWRGSYRFRNYYNYLGPWSGNHWRSEAEVIQGQWIDYDPVGFKWRTGGGYWSWSDQAWGIHTGYYIVETQRIRNALRGKTIQSVSIEIKRVNSNHGWMSGVPVHWCSHNDTSNGKTGGRPGVFGLLTSNVTIDRNGIAVIQDNNTKTLVQRIVDGSAAGFGLYKEYNGAHVRMDPAYMRFASHLMVRVSYFD